MNPLLLYFALSLPTAHPAFDPGTPGVGNAALESALSAGPAGPGTDDPAPPDSDFTAAMSLSGDPSECVALEKAGSACLVTAAEFNLAATNAVAPSDWREASPASRRKILREIRISLARSLAKGKYPMIKAGEANRRGIVETRLQAGLRERNLALAKACGEARIDSLYRGVYAHLFAKREEPEFSVLASTDSQYIDSLQRLPASPPGRSRAPADVPWGKCAGACLEEALESRADTLPSGSWTLPQRRPFASMIFRLDRKRLRPARPFEASIPLLCALANAPAPDAPPSEREARAYYEGNPGLFEVPDTLLLQAWLAPMPARKRGGAWPDTASCRPRMLIHLDLPEALRKQVRAYGHAGKFLRVNSDFGPWAFRVLSVKAGRGRVPFARALPEIMEGLKLARRKRIEQEATAAAEAKEANLRNGVAEEAILESLAPTPEELEGYMKSRPAVPGTDEPPSAGDRAIQESFYRREFARERLEKDRESWLDEGVAFFNLE